MLARSRKGPMLCMSVHTALKFPFLLMHVLAHRCPEKLCPYISLQWWQERRQEEWGDLQREEETKDSSKMEMSRKLANEKLLGQWKSRAIAKYLTVRSAV